MISAFGVEHGDSFAKRKRDPERGNKAFGDPVKTAAVTGAVGAAAISRGKANTLGGKIGQATQNRAAWSKGRAEQMKSPRGSKIRSKYADKLNAVGAGIKRNQDTKEIVGRAAVGSAVGTAAGTAVYGRKRLTTVDKP